MRAPSLRRTWWKLTSRSSVAEYSLTPMLTSPNETLPFHIDRTVPPLFARALIARSKFGRVQPMLATAVGTLPSGPGWAYEFKWDGVRALLDVGERATRLMSRLGNEVSAGYPEVIAQAAEIGA